MLAEELYKLNPWWEGPFQPELVARPRYLNFLEKNRDNRDIILITGLRRVGKTSLMKLFVTRLLAETAAQHVLYVSLDSLPLEKFTISELLREFRKLHALKLEQKVYLFFDEVAYREQAPQELKNLYDHENVKIFASSSSTSILADTRAFLTGRARVLEVLPLNFQEFLAFRKLNVRKSESYLLENYFESYMRTGGIPEYVLSNDVSYLDNLIDHVLYKDIVARHGLRDVSGIRDLFRLLMERAGKQISLNRIARTLGLSPDSVRRYVDYFRQTFLIYTIERCGKLNERLRAPKKLYAADVGLRNHITGYRDRGAVFENLVYLQIKQHQPCYVYQNGLELDFKYADVILEVKFERQLEGKQKTFFEAFPSSRKIVVETMSDYLTLEKAEGRVPNPG